MSLLGKRALIVEDDTLISLMIESFLQDLGMEVVATATLLTEALEKASEVSIDVAVLDVNLAGELSYPVARILEARNIPYLFATGYGVAALPEYLREVTVLAKPFGIQQLEKALEQTTRHEA